MERIVVLHGPGEEPDGMRETCLRTGMDLDLAVEVYSPLTEAAMVQWLSVPAVGIVLSPTSLAGSSRLAEATAGAQAPVVEVHTDPHPEMSRVGGLCAKRVHGRGIDSYRWAVRHLAERASWPFNTHRYGDGNEHMGDLRLPDRESPHAVAVLLHGGFWREQWQRDLMDALAVDLARRGYATWNLEYRRVGSSGGGWPQTAADVAAGVDALSDLASDHGLDLTRVAVVGHSAGGQLALWAAARAGFPPDVTGARPRVLPALAVSLAGVCDLHAAAREHLGTDAAQAFLGGRPEEVPERYARASPQALVPSGTVQLLAHGTADDRVPVAQSRAYRDAAVEAGDAVTMLQLDGVEHFAVIEPRSAAWQSIAEHIGALLPT